MNVTEPRTIEVKGRQLPTSIYKRATTEAVPVTASGLQGEQRASRRMCDEADHALYFYPHEHYAHWRAVLGEAELPFGYFGEGLTCEGLLEDEVRLGDVLRCGDVTVRVRQPRMPCHKLDVRAGRRLAGRFLRSLRSGFLASVLQPGLLRSGTPVEVVHRDPQQPSVRELLRLTQLDAWDADGLARLLESRELPPAWREVVELKLELARQATGWHGLRPLALVERRREARDIVSLWLACPQGRQLAPFSPGQYLTVTWRPDDDEASLRRAYCLTGEPGALDRYRITVALAEASPPHPIGEVSSGLLELPLGAVLRSSAPRGRSPLEGLPSLGRGLLIVSEGIGSATALAILRACARRFPGEPVTHLHLDRDAASVALRRESAQVAPAARRLLALRAPQPGDLESDGLGELWAGPPSAARLRELAAAADHVVVAGSSGAVDELAALLEGTGAALHVERYG